ncbi:MAG: hypothetical protein K2G45_03580 [Lachnospiraceae bacterium]|nr:hypothetical protein [Lachnospiraceae bacterium]
MQLKEFAKVSDATKTFNNIVNSGVVSNIAFKNALAGLSNQEKINIVSQSALNETQKIGALASAGLTSEELKQAVQNGSLAASQATTTGTTLGLSTAFRGLIIKIKEATASMLTFLTTNPLGWATLAIGGIIAVTTGIKHHNKKIEETRQKIRDLGEEARNAVDSINSEFESTKSTVYDVAERYATLAQKVGNLGKASQNQGTLSNDEYSEFLDISNQLAELFPRLTNGYDDNGNAILNLSGNVNTITSSLYDLVDAEKAVASAEIQGKMDGIWGEYSQNVSDYSKEYNQLNDKKRGLSSFYDEMLSEDINYLHDYYDNFKELFSKAGIDESVLYKVSTWSDFSATQQDAIRDAYAELIGEYERDIRDCSNKIESANKDFSKYLILSLQGTDYYEKLGDNKSLVNSLLTNYGYDTELNNLRGSGNWNKALEYVEKQIIKPFNDLSDEDKEVFQQYYNKLLSLDPDAALANNIVEIDKYISKLAELLHMDKNQLTIGLGYDLEADKQKIETAKTRMGYIAEPKNASDAYKNKVINDVISTLDKDDVELLAKVDISEESKNWTKEEWLNFIEELNNTAEMDITANPTKSLDSIKSAFSEFESIYEDIHNGSTVAASSIEKLNDAFGELDGGTALQEFKDVLTTMPDDIDAQQEALNKLATAYIDNSDLIKNLTEDNADYTISELKKINVANAEEVVQSRLYNQEENLKKAQEEQKNAIDSLTNTISSSTSASDILTASKYKAMAASIDLENASANEVAGLINAANAAGVDSTALKNLLADKIRSAQIAITTNGDISNLISLCKALGGTVTYLEQYSQAKNIISQGGTLTGNGTADTNKLIGLKNLADTELKNALANYGGGYATNVQYTIPNSPSNNGSDSGSSKSEESKTQIDWISRYLEQLQKTIDKTKAKFENLFSLKNKSSNLGKQIEQTTALMKAQGRAADNYLAKAKEYAKTSELSTKLQKSVQNGRLNKYSLSDLIAEYGQETANKINQYQDYWDKYQAAMQKKNELNAEIRGLQEQQYQLYVDEATANLDRITAQAANLKDNYETQNKYLGYQTKWIEQQYEYEIKIAKLTKDKTKVKQLEAEKEKALAQLEVSKFENISATYDHEIQKLTETMDKAKREIDQLEAAGKNVQESLYKSQRNTANSELKTYQEELKELENQLKHVKKGTEEWYNAKSSIEKVKDAISETTTTVYELNNAINELHFQLFEDKRTQISRIAQEYDFMLGLANDLKKVDEDTAQFTDMGYAELGVNSIDYYASLQNQNLDKQTLDELKGMLAKGILSHGDYTFNSVDDLRDKIDELYDTWQSDIQTTYNYEKSLADAVSQKYQAQLNLAQKLTDERKEALQAEKNLHDYQRTISSQVKEINTLQMQISAYQGDTSEEGMAKLQALQKSLLEAQDELRETEYDRYISDQEDMLSSLYTEYEELISKKLDDFYGLVEEGLKIANEHSADIAYALTDIANTNQYTPQFNSVITAISKGQSIQEAVCTDVSKILEVLTSSSGLDDKNDKSNNTNKTNNTNNTNKTNKTNNTNNTKNTKNANKNDKSNKPSVLVGGILLNIQDKNDKNDKNKKSSVLVPLGMQGFSNGGVISDIEKQVDANEDTVLVSAQPGERILTRVQNENFEKLINSDLIKNPIMLTNMPDFSQYTKVSDFAKSGMGGGNVAININSIDLPNVINPENFGDELANQLQNNKKIQKLTQGITYNGMLGKSTNNVRHIH